MFSGHDDDDGGVKNRDATETNVLDILLLSTLNRTFGSAGYPAFYPLSASGTK